MTERTERTERTGRTVRRTADHGLELPAGPVEAMRADLPRVADRAVAAIIAEVPSYTQALDGPMGTKIRNAVQLALGGFLSLATGRRGAGADTPTAPAVEGAYQLGRGEARSGRTIDALLAAYRVGARVSWREMSTTAVRNGLDVESLVGFAELVFAYIDELSAASVSGHNDESETAGRARQRLLERVAVRLLDGSAPEDVLAAAEDAGWAPPTTLTAVLLPQAQVRPVLAALPAATLRARELAGLEEAALLLVPDVHGHRREALLRVLRDREAIAGPPRPWLEVRSSYARASRARARGLVLDTEAHLPELVLTADAEALADLRAQALAPLAGMRPATAEKLAETLRAWLLLQGRRDEVAAALFVHPQTVRYRLGQLRERFGERLEDPAAVLALVLALAPEQQAGDPGADVGPGAAPVVPPWDENRDNPLPA